jgi:hypothetical protein
VTVPASIRALYEAFASYRRQQAIEVCPHCAGRPDPEVLPRIPTERLTCPQLSPFAFRAVSAWGDADDYRHFLPRILELAASPEGRDFPGLDLGVVASKLVLAGFGEWPAAERQAVTAYLREVWDAARAEDPEAGGWSTEEVLAAVARLVDDPAPFLDAWTADRSPTATVRLADLLCAARQSVLEASDLGVRWRGAPGGAKVARWLRDAARREPLAEALARDPAGAWAPRLSAGLETLDHLFVIAAR